MNKIALAAMLAIFIGALMLPACSETDRPPKEVVGTSKAEVVAVTAEDGRVFECLILSRNVGQQTGTVGMDCQWPEEAPR